MILVIRHWNLLLRFRCLWHSSLHILSNGDMILRVTNFLDWFNIFVLLYISGFETKPLAVSVSKNKLDSWVLKLDILTWSIWNDLSLIVYFLMRSVTFTCEKDVVFQTFFVSLRVFRRVIPGLYVEKFDVCPQNFECDWYKVTWN